MQKIQCREACYGLNAPMFKGYLRFIANRRAQQIGLDPMFAQAENPFPWMSEMIDLRKKRNFFETGVIEYQTGGAGDQAIGVGIWHHPVKRAMDVTGNAYMEGYHPI